MIGACALFLDLKLTLAFSFDPVVEVLEIVYNGLFLEAGYKIDCFNLLLGDDGYTEECVALDFSLESFNPKPWVDFNGDTYSLI